MFAWVYEQNFNALTTADLNGQDSWSGDTDYDVVTSNSFEGAKAVGATGANGSIDRTVTATTTGTLYVAMMKPDTTSDASFILRCASGDKFRITFDTSNINFTDPAGGGGIQRLVTGITVGLWYLFEIAYTNTQITLRYFNGTSWSSPVTVDAQFTGDVTGIRLNQGASGTAYWDYISPTDPTTNTLLLGAVSYWKLDESSGNAADSIRSNTLTNNNSTAYATGKINNGADFESTNSNYLSIADGTQSGLDIIHNLSISFWWKPESTTGFQWLLAKYLATGNQRSYGIYYESNTLHFAFSTNGTAITDSSYAFTPSNGTWYHVVVTYSVAGVVAIYVNNSQIGTTSSLGTSIFNSTAPFHIGNGSAIESYTDGVIDEFGIWSRVLTSDERTALYNSGSGLQYPFASGSPSLSPSSSASPSLSPSASASPSSSVSPSLSPSASLSPSSSVSPSLSPSASPSPSPAQWDTYEKSADPVWNSADRNMTSWNNRNKS